MLSVMIYLLLCWMSFFWMSLCWVPWFIYCYAECHFSDCHCAECHDLFIVMLNVIFLNVVVLIFYALFKIQYVLYSSLCTDLLDVVPKFICGFQLLIDHVCGHLAFSRFTFGTLSQHLFIHLSTKKCFKRNLQRPFRKFQQIFFPSIDDFLKSS